MENHRTPQKKTISFSFFPRKIEKKLDRQESVTLIEISRRINRLGSNFVDRRPSKRKSCESSRRRELSVARNRIKAFCRPVTSRLHSEQIRRLRNLAYSSRSSRLRALIPTEGAVLDCYEK